MQVAIYVCFWSQCLSQMFPSPFVLATHKDTQVIHMWLCIVFRCVFLHFCSAVFLQVANLWDWTSAAQCLSECVWAIYCTHMHFCSAYTPLHFTGSQVAITYRSSRLYTSWIYLLVQWLKPSSTQKVIMAQLKVILSRALAMTTNMVFYTDLKKKRQEQGAERHQERSGYQFDLWVPLRALCSQAVLLHTSILSHMGTTWSAHTSWLWEPSLTWRCQRVTEYAMNWLAGLMAVAMTSESYSVKSGCSYKKVTRLWKQMLCSIGISSLGWRGILLLDGLTWIWEKGIIGCSPLCAMMLMRVVVWRSSTLLSGEMTLGATTTQKEKRVSHTVPLTFSMHQWEHKISLPVLCVSLFHSTSQLKWFMYSLLGLHVPIPSTEKCRSMYGMCVTPTKSKTLQVLFMIVHYTFY